MANKDDKKVDDLTQQLKEAQEAVAKLQGQLEKAGVDKPKATAPADAAGGKVIEGRFDGQNMIGPGDKVYPVPANYASKSKLVEGDTLKLTIAQDGSFIYKQIGPIERKKLIATVGLENGQYVAIAGDNHYRVLYASVTYFKAQPGDEVTIVIPAHGQANWAAIEAVIGS
ncbi:hypothetical protein HYX70_00555 [Candidatus Saccharibacteria bacterium]|nr:hypothetical protein [Candidatus Saccharibacteria bacterium]